MTSRKSVTAVRPYQFEEDIRQRVFQHIESAGLELLERHIVPPGTPDDDALEIAKSRPTHVFLVPFHAHRDAAGERLTGLGFLRRMDLAAPELARCPVLMPVTASAEPAVDAYLTSPARPKGRSRVLVLPQARLDDPELRNEIRAHVDAWPL